MLTPFGVALQLLTRLPVHLRELREEHVRRAPLWFPLVGLVLGALLWLTHEALQGWLPPMVARTGVLVLGVALTGALHLDGLCDAADGLFGGSDRESALRIMRDPRAGAIGVTSVVGVLLLKQAALLSLPAAHVGPSVLLACVAGRSVMLGALQLPSARADGLAHAWAQPPSAGRMALVGLGLALGPVLWLGIGALPTLGIAVGFAATLVHMAWRRLGGVTGDVCGAAGELCETGFLLGAAAWLTGLGGGAPA